jgi:phage head maturation protease
MTATLVETSVEIGIEIRSGIEYQVSDVSYPKRIVTVVAMPYERPARIIEGGRAFTEVVSRNAFDGIEKRAGKVRANRDHSWDKPVGKVVGFHPSRKEGLVAEVKISATNLGDDTLQLCDDDILSASAGFGLLRRDDGRVWDDAEVWEQSRSVRRLNRLWLDHLAFVPNPAYGDDVPVIDVRGTAEIPPGVATPNRRRLLLEQQREQLEQLNRRWLGYTRAAS